MIRATYGATAITRVMVGRTSATQLFHGRDPGGTVLMAGRTWDTVVANRMTSTTATTNSGSAARTSSRFELVVSKTFSRLSAAHAPIAIDSGIDSTAASATSTAEFTSLGLSNVLTGSWAASDVPRLPCSRPVTQVQYWVSTGWSRCSWRRRAGRLAGQRLGGQEHQDRHQDQDEDPEQQPADDEPGHPAESEPVHDDPVCRR